MYTTALMDINLANNILKCDLNILLTHHGGKSNHLYLNLIQVMTPTLSLTHGIIQEGIHLNSIPHHHTLDQLSGQLMKMETLTLLMMTTILYLIVLKLLITHSDLNNGLTTMIEPNITFTNISIINSFTFMVI